MPAKYVRPYSKGQKNDFRDAEAIADAVQRPTMKFVATSMIEQSPPSARALRTPATAKAAISQSNIAPRMAGSRVARRFAARFVTFGRESVPGL
jgi:transposase